jgi:hypothetical protein
MAQMTIRQAARWAERKDALYIHGDFQNPLCAVWSSSNHEVALIGSYDKCRAWIKSSTDCQHIPTAGIYYRAADGHTFRFDPLDDIASGMDESEAESLVPERDFRCEAWAC